MDSKGQKVLCFGDSLTSGYLHFGMDSHPYAVQLGQRLREARPNSEDEVCVDGEPGEQASSVFMKKRLKDDCTFIFVSLYSFHHIVSMIPTSCYAMDSDLPICVVKGTTYDWVIILGGTKYVQLPYFFLDPLLGMSLTIVVGCSDIGSMRSGDNTFKALKELWDIALEAGSKVLALTVPDCSMRVSWLDEARDTVNKKILSHEAPNL